MEVLILILILGILGYILGELLQKPPLLFYLLFGLAIGPLGFNLVDPNKLTSITPIILETSLAIILFEGGLSLVSYGFSQPPPSFIRNFLILNIISFIFAFLTSLIFFKPILSYPYLFFLTTLTLISGPTVINPILKMLTIKRNIELYLHWESIWIDIVGILLASIFIQIIANQNPSQNFYGLLPLGIGTFLGTIGGFILHFLLEYFLKKYKKENLIILTSLGFILTLFFLSEFISTHSGPLAMVISGFVLAKKKGNYLEQIHKFKDIVSTLAISFLFILISDSIYPKNLLDNLSYTIPFSLAIFFLVRPLASILGLKNNLKEKIFIGYMGAKGIICLAMASYLGLIVKNTQQEIILETTFILILISALSVSISSNWLAKKCKVVIDTEATGILIIGINPFSIELGKVLSNYIPIAFIDSNPNICSYLQSNINLPACSYLLDEDVYEKSILDGYNRVLILDLSPALNELATRVVLKFFNPNNIYSIQNNQKESNSFKLIKTAFTKDFDLKKAIESIGNKEDGIKIVEKIESNDIILAHIIDKDKVSLDIKDKDIKIKKFIVFKKNKK